MTTARHQAPPAGDPEDAQRGDGPAKGPLFDISALDLSARIASRAEIEHWNPHRDKLSLLDWIVHVSDDRSQGVALKHTRDDEFWVKGHFPGRPMFPGVLMIETGAQLACYLFLLRTQTTKLVAFLRIEQAAFRASVGPGEDLYFLCDELKVGRRQFRCDIQGFVIEPAGTRKPAFEARVSGMLL